MYFYLRWGSKSTTTSYNVLLKVLIGNYIYKSVTGTEFLLAVCKYCSLSSNAHVTCYLLIWNVYSYSMCYKMPFNVPHIKKTYLSQEYTKKKNLKCIDRVVW